MMSSLDDIVADPRARFLLGFGAYFLALWFLWDTALVYPLKVFVVLLHEISHGVATIATGGSIEEIGVSRNQGGFCDCRGGSRFVTLSAGYLGSLGWGALFLILVRARRSWARVAIAVIGVSVVGVAALFVRTAFGLVFSVGFGVALIAAARYLSLRANILLLTTLGLTSCLYAILDIKSDILDRPQILSDARMLGELTGVPTVLWGVLWIIVAGWVSWRLFKWALTEGR